MSRERHSAQGPDGEHTAPQNTFLPNHQDPRLERRSFLFTSGGGSAVAFGFEGKQSIPLAPAPGPNEPQDPKEHSSVSAFCVPQHLENLI